MEISRRVGMRISPREVLLFIRQHYKFINGTVFPDDMEYAGATYDFDSNPFNFKVISNAFNEVPEGEVMPYYNIEKVVRG